MATCSSYLSHGMKCSQNICGLFILNLLFSLLHHELSNKNSLHFGSLVFKMFCVKIKRENYNWMVVN